MTRKSDLVVLICHGPDQTPTVYGPLVESLRTVGIEAHCPQLPLQLPESSLKQLRLNDVNDPTLDRRHDEDAFASEGDEVSVIISELVSLVMKRSRRVLLVTHATRSRVATQAAKEALQEQVRRQWGLIGGVIGIFYVEGEIPVVESMQTFLAARSDAEVIPGLFSLWKTGSNGQGHSAASSDDEQQEDANGSQHGEFGRAPVTASSSNGSMKLSDATCSPLPCAYLFLGDGNRLPKDFHEGGSPTVYRCPPSSSPHLSWTKNTVEKVISFSNKLSNSEESWS
ncbi:Alpha/beta hydrolase fold-1 [Xylariaceae sp. FL1272]|nr:Alpha/beta hydrolase fold-1 [Xylariaceae sp. FL1272]